uniref:CCHC-type domain-containing protein n=1 Tax=Rhizophora mucronata TaxID=61149 RepID=A0A2P2P7W1_RHIMU
MSLKLDQQILKGRPIKISCAIPKNNAKVHQTTVHTSDNTHSAVPNNRVEVHLNTVSTSDGTDSGAVSSSSGKIKRRTCYECGEKGHISTDCPKKQAAGPSNSNTI